MLAPSNLPGLFSGCAAAGVALLRLLPSLGLSTFKGSGFALGWLFCFKDDCGTYRRSAIYTPERMRNDQTACPQATPEDQAHWKLKPPRWPVTSTASPMK